MESIHDVGVVAMRRCCSLLLFFLMNVFLLPVSAQIKAPQTDPLEVKAVNSIFSQWGIRSTPNWNISGNPCTGMAIDVEYSIDQLGSAGIKCDCSYNNNTTCHITRLMVIKRDIVGVIPDELQYLKYLQRLKLDRNYLTGPLPAFLGSIANLTFLSVAFNSLSGTIPKELGNLYNLTALSIGHNNFSGSLPPELGRLVNLQEFYGNSAGLGGEIPSTFANLQNLKIVLLMDNDFTGRIPNFIGGWTKLKELRMYGNSFQGPIPSSFSNLYNIRRLFIGEVNGSSSLAFTKNMTRLESLVIRNCMISDVVPNYLNDFPSLVLLDLSFNNISGLIPSSLFKSKSLTSVLLGSNNLWGNMPGEKSSNIKTIDLSYNNISGSFPSWVEERDLYLNLVGNNFSEDDINSVTSLPSGLHCLQRGRTCRNRYYQFGINCGGPEIGASDGTMYEDDQTNLGGAGYHMNNARSWAVSNVGVPDKGGPFVNGSVNLINTSNVELFQDLRFSASSLRYFGIGLQNGNYSLKLDFVESTFSNDRTWTSLGRRVFDIFIQGELREKDFDIRKEAGGVSFTVVSKEYTANVTQNSLEIHLFWAGKGTSAVPSDGNYGPSIASVRVKPNFKPAISRSSGWHKALIAGTVSGFVLFSLLVLGIIFWRRRQILQREMDREFLGLAIRPHCFSYSELRSATDDFSTSNKLGEGGFGTVYKGMLSDGRPVAVKQLLLASNHGVSQFATEMATISAVQHRNLVTLYGCCCEGDRKMLVYEYLENKSLDQCLFGKNKLQIDWPARFKICVGMARGLAYLHEESRPRIIHRDIKAANILLDGELNPKISDFGLAKLYDDKMTHISTKVAGTLGYLAPEYAMKGHLTEKTDVFAFGVVALEIVAGRPNVVSSLDEEKMYLLEWAWRMHKEKSDLKLIDQSLKAFDKEEAIHVIRIALLCTQGTPELRPTMSQVVSMLVGDCKANEIESDPGYLFSYLLEGNDVDLSGRISSTSNQLNSSSGWSMSNQLSTSAGQSTGTSFATSAKESFPILTEKN